MNTSKYYLPDQQVWDWKKQQDIIEGVYKFHNTKNFINEIKDVTGFENGHEYAFIYEKDQGWPHINLVVSDHTKLGYVKHGRWQCYVSNIPEHTFNEMIEFLTK